MKTTAKIFLFVLVITAFVIFSATVLAETTVSTLEEFKEAIQNAASGATIKITADISLDNDLIITNENAFTIMSEDGRTITCGGYRIIIGPNADVTVGGTLNITGSAPSTVGVQNSGAFILAGGTVANSSETAESAAVLVSEYGTATISGGTINASETGLLIAGDTGTASVTGTSQITGKYGIKIAGGSLTLDGGSISGTIRGIEIGAGQLGISVSDNLSVSGGIYTETGSSILSALPSPVTVTAGESAQITLAGIGEGISFAVDSATDSELSASIDSSTVTVQPPMNTPAGEYKLVLRADSESWAITLTTPVSVQPLPDISGDFTDPNFKQAVWEWLGNPPGSTPGVFTKQDLIDRMPEKYYSLDVSSKNISSLEGLEHFQGTGIKELNCAFNILSTLPDLPDSLTDLYCSENQLTILPDLPDSLKKLECFYNKLSQLPDLPESLVYLDIGGNYFTSLPSELPDNLEELYCAAIGLSELPDLPDSLIYLECSSNNLTSLPDLPDNLEHLICQFNMLSQLPDLPDSLIELVCGYNDLSDLPSLPGSLRTLACQYNELSVLPPLPDSLSLLYCDNNNLTELPSLLNTNLVHIDCGYNQLEELPPLPPGLDSLFCSSNKLQQLPELPSSLNALICNNNILTNLPELPATFRRLEYIGNRLTALPELPSGLTGLRCYWNFIYVFSGAEKAKLDACQASYKEIAPQYRYFYTGDDHLSFDNINLKYSIDMTKIIKQVSSDGETWNNVTGAIDYSLFQFSSSDESVAAVDSNGVVTPVRNGTCEIYIRFAGIASDFTQAVIQVDVLVPEPPAVITQPASKTVTAGETVTLTVEVTGDEPLSYQWRKDGINLTDGGKVSGANTHTLTINNVQLTDACNYTCYIKNDLGEMTSEEAVLTVEANIDPDNSSVELISGSVIEANVANIELKLRIKNENGNPLSGNFKVKVDYRESRYWLFDSNFDDNGTAIVHVSETTADSYSGVNVEVSADGINWTHIGQFNVTVLPADPINLFVTADPDVLFGGGGKISTVTAVVTDEYGNRVLGVSISFAENGAGELDANSGETDENGQVSVNYTTAAGDDEKTVIVTVEALSAGLSGSASITVKGPDVSGDFTDLAFRQAIWEWLGNPQGSTPGSFSYKDIET